MTIEEIYQLAIKMGIAADPRGPRGVSQYLKRLKKEYEEQPKTKREEFDRESLTNPYADTRILFGDATVAVDKILIGVDISSAEVLLADRLNEKGEGIDLIIGHHPHGIGYAGLDEVMDLQVDLLEKLGVPVNVAEGLMKERMMEVKRSVGPRNHFQSVDSARLLGIPFMCIHTPFDNLGYKFINDLLKKEKPRRVKDVMEMLKKIPEYAIAAKQKAGPMVVTGDEKNRAGRVEVAEFTGGTEGSKLIYEKMVAAGIGTIIGMHLSEEHVKEARKHHLNVVAAGHMVSDSLGMNLFLDELKKRGIEAVACSGLIRIKRG